MSVAFIGKYVDSYVPTTDFPTLVVRNEGDYDRVSKPEGHCKGEDPPLPNAKQKHVK